MSAPAEIIERIKKLLRLSRSSNPHEAELALERAMKLAEQYRVAIDGLKPDAETPSVTQSSTKVFAQMGYDRKFASLLVKRFFRVHAITCAAIRHVDGWPRAGEKISFVGTASDLEVALYVYHFLVQHFTYCWKKHRGRMRNRYSFVYGMFCGIYAKLAAAESPASERSANGTELVLSVEAYLARHFPNRESKPLTRPEASAAANAGFIQGQKTEIRSAIKTESEPVLALQ